MEVFLTIIFFVTSVVMLVWGVKLLSDCCVNISRLFGISQLVVSTAVVSIVSILPNILVSIFAIKQNAQNLIVGNIYGSMTFNFLILLGGVLLIKPMKINIKKFNDKISLYLIALLLLFVFSISKHISWIESCVLCIIFLIFYVQNINKSKDIEMRRVIVNSKEKVNKILLFDTSLLFLIGFLLIIFGAKYAVVSSINLSNLTRINQKIVGYTVLIIATCMTEIMTIFSLVKRGFLSDILGDVVCNNIQISTLIISLTSLINGGVLLFGNEILLITVMLIISCIFIIFSCKKRDNTHKIYGLSLIILYIISLIILLK